MTNVNRSVELAVLPVILPAGYWRSEVSLSPMTDGLASSRCPDYNALLHRGVNKVFSETLDEIRQGGILEQAFGDKGWINWQDFLKEKDHRAHFKKFFAFNSWIAASLAISSVPLDNYFLLKFAGPVATGIYAAPYKILAITDQLAGNFSRVLAPRFSSFTNDTQAIIFSKKTIPIVLFVISAILTAGILAEPIVRILLGNEYINSIPVFRVVAASYAFYFADTIAVSLIVYYLGKPNITFLITIIVIIIWAISSYILIPKYQAIGAAFADLISGITALSLFTGFVVWHFSKKIRTHE